MKSIRRSLTISLLTSLFILLAIFGALLFVLIRSVLIREFDESLLSKARSLAPMAMLEPVGTIEFEFSEEMLPAFLRGADPEYFEIWHESGNAFARSGSLGPDLNLPRPIHSSQNPVFTNMTLPDGRQGRAVHFTYAPPRDPDEDFSQSRLKISDPATPRLLLMVALSREKLDHTLHQLLELIMGAWIGLPLLVALIVHRSVKRGMRPLARLAQEADAFDFNHLQHRFAETEMPLELHPICRRLNDLLQRIADAFKSIESAYARERRFSNDVAHELRTPIAELHSLSEIALLFPHKQELNRKALSETLDISRQLERLVSTLLSLARCEGGIEQLRRESIDLNEAVAQAWKSVQDRVSERGVHFSQVIPEAIHIHTDRAMLNSILGNLISNAADHCPAKGSIHILAQTRGHNAILRIENANSNLTQDDMDHLFEQFWQKDSSRTNSGHSGLGLALVQKMCQLLGIGLSITLDEDCKMVIAELSLPQAP